MPPTKERVSRVMQGQRMPKKGGKKVLKKKETVAECSLAGSFQPSESNSHTNEFPSGWETFPLGKSPVLGSGKREEKNGYHSWAAMGKNGWSSDASPFLTISLRGTNRLEPCLQACPWSIPMPLPPLPLNPPEFSFSMRAMMCFPYVYRRKVAM